MAEKRFDKAGKEYFPLHTGSEPKRGRPSFLTDEALWARRDEFAGRFVNEWPELGWELWRARTASDVNRIFTNAESRMPGEPLRRFRIVSSVAFDDLAANRQKREGLSAPVRDAFEAMNDLGMFRDRVAGALRDPNIEGRLELEGACRRLTRDWEERRAGYERLSAEVDELRTRIEMQEAAFAQAELLRFIGEKRYAWNPVNLANAMAGLGYMTYRQSVNRCLRRKSMASNSLQYEVFRAISYVCEQTGPQQLLAEVRERVMSLPRRYASAQREMKQNFYFLRRAVEDSVRCRYRGMEFNFSVSQKYSRWLRSMSLLDEVRAYEQQLQ